MEASVTTIESFKRGESIEVAPAKIESELQCLWRQASAGADHPITRACLWNLIVRSGVSETERVRAKKLVDDMSERVAFRALVAFVDANAEEAPLRTWVEANWRAHSASEEVTLLGQGATAARIPSMLRSLLVADAPTAMLWLGAPPADWLKEPLIDEVGRLIIDTRRAGSERDLHAVGALADAVPSLEIVDLAWLGVRPLRGLLASLFDPPTCHPSRLGVLDRVRVTAGVAGVVQSRALLSLGWLSSRLGWTAHQRTSEANGTRSFRARRADGGTVAIDLVTRADDPRHHGVSAVVLEAGDKRWSLERTDNVTVEAPDLPPRCQPVRSHSDSELCTASLGAAGRDVVYREALAGAVRFVEAA
jgi:glucose-6-phosphate dehydrogenase assembly protein OpcA